MARRGTREAAGGWSGGFAVGLARAAGGAVVFSLPLLMTMEMWTLGVHMAPGRLLLLLAVSVPLLVGLSYIAGFEESFDVVNDVVDACVALGVGMVASAAILLLLGVIRADMAPREIVGPVALQAVPGAIGALLAQTQFQAGAEDEEAVRRTRERQESSYGWQLFTMIVGALFLALNIAPTDEIMIIASLMSETYQLALVVATLAGMHAFVYALEFRGSSRSPAGVPWWHPFLRYTVTGYALALLLGAYLLWSFGRADGLAAGPLVAATVVLAFPASVGAAAARLVL